MPPRRIPQCKLFENFHCDIGATGGTNRNSVFPQCKLFENFHCDFQPGNNPLGGRDPAV